MATRALGADSALANPLSIFSTFDRSTIAKTVEVLVCVLDAMEPDADLEPAGDEQDGAWIEWSTMRGSEKRGPNITQMHEDSEDDDPAGIHDEDGINTCFDVLSRNGPGCSIADPGGCEHDGREEGSDEDREQMHDDVPMLPVVSAEYNIFSDERSLLGISNLQSSFVGQDIRSADSGALHTGRSLYSKSAPGVPV